MLDQLPDGFLEDALAYVKKLQKHSEKDLELTRFVQQTLIEDRAILQKLA